MPLTVAQRAIVESSTLVLRLALSMTRGAMPLAYDDLVSVGNEELVRAASRFDEDVGVAFDAYAYTSVHFAMRKAIALARRDARTVLPAGSLGAGYDVLDVERAASPLDESPADAAKALDDHCEAMAAALATGFAATMAHPRVDSVPQKHRAHAELLDEIGQVLEGMPAARRLVELRYYEAREWDDVAAALGCSSATARREHASAMRLLGARLRAREAG